MPNPHAPLPFSAAVHPDARPAARLTWDSREAGPDVAFVALPGENMHGNRFVDAALAAGAPFVLTDLDVPRAVQVQDAQEALFAWARHERAKNALVVGITGSAGKTTAKSYAAAALDAKEPDHVELCAMAKLFVTDRCFDIADRSLQLFGGYGYLSEYGIEKIVRDLRVHRILEGTNEIMRVVVGRAVAARGLGA